MVYGGRGMSKFIQSQINLLQILVIVVIFIGGMFVLFGVIEWLLPVEYLKFAALIFMGILIWCFLTVSYLVYVDDD
jgi:hypothetical protein